MKRTHIAGLDAIVSDEPTKTGQPLVVLCHGYGAPGDDLVGLQEMGWPPAEYVFPMAPLLLDPEAGDYDGAPRAWWQLEPRDFEHFMSKELQPSPPGLQTARVALEALVTELVKQRAPSSLVLGGFSQGSMVAVETGLRLPAEIPLHGLLVLSGTLLDAGWDELAQARPGLPVFVSHGTADPLLPYQRALRLKDLFGKAGCVVEWSPFDGGHGIPPPVLARAGRFLDRANTTGPR